jgi:hypothetical protein
MLHELGARALASTPAEADAARDAARAAREHLLEDAPPAARERLQALLERRLQDEVTPHAS